MRIVYASLLGALTLPAALGAQAVKFVTAPTGNSAHYTARELLAMNTIENDAVGTTTMITGSIALDALGKVDATGSHFTVLLDSLKTDRSMRDRYVRNNTVETAKYPTAELAITDIRGLPAKLPTSGTLTLQLVGNLTIHGVTKPSMWNSQVTFDATGITGSATTEFKFADFSMTQPSVPILASLHDTIKLQYDFHMVRQ